ncbi:essential subunit of the RNA polymerase II mediator complex, putative [Candida dubliniensis CD36]|uniref:Mediator of RNA polymerase II transcription subunit 11 n=1 Tax=Candida dubliniensis (strain CD36 / ATCC MYA-646 / CBS 7987 / NCPF 3949 / NRRL Y-17841) TaxID=573826 RepID=B9WK16_CANDC|nr:essential subunit of the RNA polymerase II mediator complex, putative [Candida dubliniensis CD36]CAX40667.1 essential subunit of the RNA polymerase II mediator complex, putative [Candida dubliniensis CD36]
MSSLNNEKAENFIQERLDSLHEIDCKVVTLLDQFSSIFQSFYTKDKEEFSQQTSDIYSTLSKVAIDLRKEIKIMDDNIGAYDKNDDNVMILPISNVDQKNTKLGRKRLNLELAELKRLISDAKEVENIENDDNDNNEIQPESDGNQIPQGNENENENENDQNNNVANDDTEMKD